MPAKKIKPIDIKCPRCGARADELCRLGSTVFCEPRQELAEYWTAMWRSWAVA